MIPWNRRYAMRSYVLSSLWLAPVIAVILQRITLRISNLFTADELGWIPGYQFTEAGVPDAMDINVSLNLSFIVFAFSSMLVAIQVASAQLTPRIIATILLRDNVVRCIVALFVYAMLVASAVRHRYDEMPHFFASFASILTLVSVVGFVFLIDYAARLLRPVSIIWRVGRAGLRVIESVYPLQTMISPALAPTRLEFGPSERTVEHRGKSGIVIAVNLQALIAEAKRADGIIEFVPHVGDFVAVGEPLILLRGGAVAIRDDMLRGQVAWGPERTIEQDSTFAFRVIVDIAAKALSKAINDPTTAVLAIDQLQRLLRVVGRRHLHDENVFDKDGRLRVIFRTPNWDDFVQLAFTEIRHYGAENIQIVRRLRAMGEDLRSLPEHRHAALRQQLDLLDRALEKLYVFPEDLALARVADSQGLGGASGTKA